MYNQPDIINHCNGFYDKFTTIIIIIGIENL